jgi:hypothetical protein
MTFLKNPSLALFKKLIKRKYALDQVIAIALLCLSVLIIILSLILNYFSGIPLTSAILAGALVYLLLRNRLATGVTMSPFQYGSRIRSLCHIVFIITLSLMIYITWSNVYYRPPIYFVLLLVAAASIVIDIFALDETKRLQIFITLFKIIILSLTVYLSLYQEFPRILGIDSWWHNLWTQDIINLGHVTIGEFGSNDYYLFPMFHIWGAITQMVTNVSTNNAIFISTAVMMVIISSLFVFLIGEKLVNVKVGILAALIVPLTDQLITRGSAIIAMSLAFCFFPALLYLVLARDKKRFSDILLVILFSVTLILTHTIGALVTLLSLIVIYIAMKLFKGVGKLPVSYSLVSSTLLTFFGLFMVFRWMQPHPVTRSFFDVNLSNLIETFQSAARFVMTGTATIKNVASAVTVFNDGGYILLLALGVIGALTYINHKNRTRPMMALVSLTAFLIFTPQMLDLFSITNLLPDRWYLFSYVVLSITAISGLFRISGVVPGNIGKISVILLMVLAIIFMMTTNRDSNADSPMVFNSAERLGYTQSEQNVINTLCDIGSGRPMTDVHYGYMFPFVAGYERYANLTQGKTRVFILRNYYLHHPEWDQYYMDRIIRGALYDVGTRRELITDYMKVWGIDSWPIIYRNNNITVYSNASLPAQTR